MSFKNKAAKTLMEIKELKKENKELKKENKELKKEYNKLRNIIIDFSDEMGVMEKEMHEYKLQLRNCDKELKQTKNYINELNNEILIRNAYEKDLKSEMAALDKDIEQLKQKLINQDNRRKREISSMNKEHDDTVIELNKQITKLKNDLEDEKKFSSNINQVYMKDYWENYKGKKRIKRKTKRRHNKK